MTVMLQLKTMTHPNLTAKINLLSHSLKTMQCQPLTYCFILLTHIFIIIQLSNLGTSTLHSQNGNKSIQVAAFSWFNCYWCLFFRFIINPATDLLCFTLHAVLYLRFFRSGHTITVANKYSYGN